MQASQPTTSIADTDATTALRSTAILVVDDEPGMRNFLRRALQRECALLEVADSVDSGEALRRRFHFDLLVVDIRLPGRSGIEWLEQLRADGERTEVIFISAFADLDMAVAALRAGAADLVLKPFRLEQILTAIQRCLERRATRRENTLLKRQVGGQGATTRIVGEGSSIRELYQVVERVAPTSATILIEGETGSGKELIARAIHEQSGREGAFVAVNCGSIAADLLESELFGHTKGAFTGAHSAREGLFAYAHQGTLFLDEVAELPLPLQSKLLRALEEQSVRPVGADREVPVDSRVIAATNKHLRDVVTEGGFREDLFYRLNVVTVRVPALRERREDVAILTDHFNATLAGELGVHPLVLQPSDRAMLEQYAWPGNVRELRNVVERSLLLGELPGDLCQPDSAPGAVHAAGGYPDTWTLEQVEKQHLLTVFERLRGNKSATARRLGISRKTMERRLRRWESD
ncbi:MAG: sigma-54 dependent transcriptional regulator [Gammaproteobacteria bacterium]|nr:sigma-54 dependent transcriptional regulator [Gammaproteobacteria bacterium]